MNCFGSGNSWIIILVIILLFSGCGNWGTYGSGCGCNNCGCNNCGCNNCGCNDCGCGC